MYLVQSKNNVYTLRKSEKLVGSICTSHIGTMQKMSFSPVSRYLRDFVKMLFYNLQKHEVICSLQKRERNKLTIYLCLVRRILQSLQSFL